VKVSLLTDIYLAKARLTGGTSPQKIWPKESEATKAKTWKGDSLFGWERSSWPANEDKQADWL